MDENEILLEDSRALLRQMIRGYRTFKRGTIKDDTIDFERDLTPEEIQEIKQGFQTRRTSLIEKVNSVSAQ